MSTVADVLAHKGNAIVTISGKAPVLEAIRKMLKWNVGSVVISDPADPECVVGIFTERDYLRRIVLLNRDPESISVGDVMTRDLVCTEPQCSVNDCMLIMTHDRIRHVPVVDRGAYVGIVSIGDLIKHLCVERDSEVKNLTDYITGRYPGEVGAGLW